MAHLRPLHKAMVRLGTIILHLGLIPARRLGLGVGEHRRAAERQVAAAPRVAVPQVARLGVEAAARAVAPTVAGAGVQAAITENADLKLGATSRNESRKNSPNDRAEPGRETTPEPPWRRHPTTRHA